MAKQALSCDGHSGKLTQECAGAGLYVQLELVRAEVEALRGRDLRNHRHPPSTAFPA